MPVLPLMPADARSDDDHQLLSRLRQGDPLALAALYSRTEAAAHACARRLLSDPLEVEALLVRVYRELWSRPPEEDECPEGWVRRRCFALGAGHLHELGRPPAAASTAMLLPALSAAAAGPAEEVERRIAALPDGPRMALLRAVDAGVPSAQQRAWMASGAAPGAEGQPDPPRDLAAALRALGGEEAPTGASGCDEPRLGDWVLGLLDLAEAAQVARVVAHHPACAAEASLLRHGRSRLDGSPPPADLGPRVIAAALAGGDARIVPRTLPAEEPQDAAPRPVSGSAGAHFARTVLGMLLLLLGAAVGLYVGQAIVAAL